MNDLEYRVIELTQQEWTDRGVPLLLSRLGACDNGDIARLAKERSNNLEAYLRSYLVNRVQVVRHSARHQLVGVLPVDVDVDSGADALLEKTQSTSKDEARRYHPAFWAAFRKPLDESKRRYVSIQEPIRFVDSSETDPPDAHYEIAREYIADPDFDPEQVQKKVQQWLTDKGIRHLAYSLMPRPRPENMRSGDLLDRLLHSLEPEDLKRISMPLDVIRKLRRQRP